MYDMDFSLQYVCVYAQSVIKQQPGLHLLISKTLLSFQSLIHMHVSWWEKVAGSDSLSLQDGN